jgi:dTDP-4-amino-4,6-dideoxygalactose transaminase
MSDKPIYVTRPFLPPLEEFIPQLQAIWDRKVVTNNGPFHRQFEEALARFLGVEHLCLFTNGTIALITALQASRVSGEVITTPYSFVATSHSLLWNGMTPVFVDVDPATCNIDPRRIEDAITPRTSAILAVHCYGNPCAVERLREIAETYGLTLIYDAAHAFGVRHRGGSLLRHGDMSVLSFHATKVFNTFEGGAIVCQDARTKRRIDFLKNFGFADEVTVTAPGINGKMNEFSAALGLLQLQHVDGAFAARAHIEQRYRAALSTLRGLRLLDLLPDTEGNSAYFPIFIQPDFGISRDQLYEGLRGHGIFARRYFHPLISQMPMYRALPSAAPDNLPQATRLAQQVLCLPIYPGLDDDSIDKICQVIADLGAK